MTTHHSPSQLLASAILAVTAFIAEAPADVATPGASTTEYLRPIAGGRRHGWFALPVQPGGPSTASTLYHIPVDAEPGAARVVRTLPQIPVDIASMDDSAVLVYASRGGLPRPVRQITASRLRPQWYIYTEPAPLPPLPGWGSFMGFIGHESGPVALLKADDSGRPHLFRLRLQHWQPLAPPFAVASDSSWTLLGLGPAIGLIERAPNAASASIWVGLPEDDGAVRWERREAALGERDEVFGADAQIISLTRSREGVLGVNLLRGAAFHPIASFTDVPSSAVAVAVGDRLTFAWEPNAPSLRLMTRAITLSGRSLHEGWAPLSNPVSTGELQVLGAALGSLVLTVLIFLLKPDRGVCVVTLPPGASLAEPSRRLLATAIDLVPGLLLASAIWDNPETPTQFADVGVLPLAVVAGVTILHTAIAEAVFGRTLGKAVLGCRVVTIQGERVRWSQALGRNIAKTLCPGLVVFVIANPFVPQPGAFGTVVILEPPDDDSGKSGSGGAPPVRDRDSGSTPGGSSGP